MARIIERIDFGLRAFDYMNAPQLFQYGSKLFQNEVVAVFGEPQTALYAARVGRRINDEKDVLEILLGVSVDDWQDRYVPHPRVTSRSCKFRGLLRG